MRIAHRLPERLPINQSSAPRRRTAPHPASLHQLWRRWRTQCDPFVFFGRTHTSAKASTDRTPRVWASSATALKPVSLAWGYPLLAVQTCRSHERVPRFLEECLQGFCSSAPASPIPPVPSVDARRGPSAAATRPYGTPFPVRPLVLPLRLRTPFILRSRHEGRRVWTLHRSDISYRAETVFRVAAFDRRS